MEFKKLVHDTSKLSPRAAIILAVLALTMWQSGKQPFIPSDDWINLLIWGGTPIVSITLLYHIFFRQDKKTGLTTYQINKPKFKSKYAKIAHKIFSFTILVPAASLLFSFGFQWYPAWPTKLFTNQTSTMTAYIIEIDFNRKLGMPNLDLANLDTQDTFTLFWPEQEGNNYIQADKVVVLHTKHNWFGDYVVNITKPVLD